MKIKTTAFLFFFYSVYLLCGKVYIDKEYKFFIDFPENWTFERKINTKNLLSAANKDKNIIFHLNIYKNKFNSIDVFFDDIKKELNAEGDRAFFSYLKNDAILSNLIFHINKTSYRGFFVFIKDENKFYLLYSYCSEENYQRCKDFILSVLDAFSLNEKNKLSPGPVSSFYYIKKDSNTETAAINILGQIVSLEKDQKEIESTDILVEREARVLAAYTYSVDNLSPWKRFFNIIFRDNYSRLKPSFEKISSSLGLEKETKEGKIKKIARWVQNFNYERSGTLSDLTPPMEALFYNKGDCDSRSILFLLFMRYLDIDSIILVSTEYKHSAVGVNIDYNGAKVTFEKKKYLFIELTEEVEPGLVLLNMSDASKWIPMQIGY